MNTLLCMLIAAQHPKEIINTLRSKYKLKVKGDGPLNYHLGADYCRDPDGTMVSQPRSTLKNSRRPM